MSQENETTFIKSVKLRGGREIQLAPNAIVVLVGANNSGKSFFLKCLQSQLWGFEMNEVAPQAGLIESIKIGWAGRDTNEYLLNVANEHFQLAPQGGHAYVVPFAPGGRSSYITAADIGQVARSSTHLGLFAQVFFELDDALDRILETDQKSQAEPRGGSRPNILKAMEDRPAANKIFSYFRSVFYQALSFYDHRGKAGFLLSAPLPNAARAGEARDQETIKHMEASPKLWNQGLGMRSVAGLLLRIFASSRSIMAIDEPEAFLHPPQAGALGAALAQIADEEKRQMFIATHELNLLNSLLENANRPVTIIQLKNEEGEYSAHEIEPKVLNEAKSKSIVRYSTILNSLFVRFTVLTENEKDAYFYSSAMNHYFSNPGSTEKNVSIHDFHFLNVSGKNNFEKTLAILSELGEAPVVIADLDVIADSNHVDSILEAIQVPADGRLLVAQRIVQLFDKLEELGKYNPRTKKLIEHKTKILKGFHKILDSHVELGPVIDELLEALDSHRIFLLPWGELEDFAPEYPKQEWIQKALDARVHEGAKAKSLVVRVEKQLL